VDPRAGLVLPTIKESLLELVLEWSTTRIFVAEITDGFILGLDVMQENDASVDLRRHVLRLGDEEVRGQPLV
jgi:hypothetical protein